MDYARNQNGDFFNDLRSFWLAIHWPGNARSRQKKTESSEKHEETECMLQVIKGAMSPTGHAR